jgi:hypothetical protein
MRIYLGRDPDSSEALEFLSLAEAAGITHHEVLNAMAGEIKNDKFVTEMRAVISEKQGHRQAHTKLAKQMSTASM